MTKATVLEKLGLASDTALAAVFGIQRSAVSQWADDRPIPLVRQYELKAMRPDLFFNVPVVDPKSADKAA